MIGKQQRPTSVTELSGRSFIAKHSNAAVRYYVSYGCGVIAIRAGMHTAMRIDGRKTPALRCRNLSYAEVTEFSAVSAAAAANRFARARDQFSTRSRSERKYLSTRW